MVVPAARRRQCHIAEFICHIFGQLAATTPGAAAGGARVRSGGSVNVRWRRVV